MLTGGLKRASINNAATWAERYRRIGGSFPGPWKWKYHPWLKGMHESTHPENVVQKGAQLGVSELAMNVVFYLMDIRKWNCLYVLPNSQPDAANFSSGRFDPAIKLSPRLQEMFTETDNVGMKRSGSVCLYVRGSNSESQLKSIPVSCLIFDELEEMNQDNIPLAEKRSDGQLAKVDWKISTPRTANKGINRYYSRSTQDSFAFRCPSCSRFEILRFPESLVVTATDIDDPKLADSHLICTQCKAVLPHETKPEWLSTGEWVPKYSGRQVRGFHISQLYSSALAGVPATLARRYLLGLTNVFEEQELYNSCLGVPHTVSRDQVTESLVQECMGSYTQVFKGREGHLYTMGVDVGSVLHVVIVDWTFIEGIQSDDYNASAFAKVVYANTVPNFEQVWRLFENFNTAFCVVDALPETRKAKEFASYAPDRIKLCYYNHNLQSRDIIGNTESQYHVSVSRTMWFDMLFSRFKLKMIQLAHDIHADYMPQICAMVKVPRRNRHGIEYFAYDSTGADHFAHAHCYAEIALTRALGGGSPVSTSVPL